jgi:hypothetical protein
MAKWGKDKEEDNFPETFDNDKWEKLDEDDEEWEER